MSGFNMRDQLAQLTDVSLQCGEEIKKYIFIFREGHEEFVPWAIKLDAGKASRLRL